MIRGESRRHGELGTFPDPHGKLIACKQSNWSKDQHVNNGASGGFSASVGVPLLYSILAVPPSARILYIMIGHLHGSHLLGTHPAWYLMLLDED